MFYLSFVKAIWRACAFRQIPQRKLVEALKGAPFCVLEKPYCCATRSIANMEKTGLLVMSCRTHLRRANVHQIPLTNSAYLYVYIMAWCSFIYILVCLCNMSKCHPVRFLFAAFNSSLAVNFWWHFALSEAVSRSRGKSLPVLKVLKLQRHSNPFCIFLLKQDLDIGWFDSTGKLLEIAPLHKNDSKAKRAVNFHWFPIPCGLVEICRVCRAIQEILCEWRPIIIIIMSPEKNPAHRLIDSRFGHDLRGHVVKVQWHCIRAGGA